MAVDSATHMEFGKKRMNMCCNTEKESFTVNQSPNKDEKQKILKSERLLAKGYEPIIGLTVPLRTSGKDVDVENLEPKNAKKLSIYVAPGRENRRFPEMHEGFSHNQPEEVYASGKKLN